MIARWHPWLRRVVIGVPAFLLVWVLARAFDMRPFAELAAVPTLVAALVLEHRTRRRPWQRLAAARVAT